MKAHDRSIPVLAAALGAALLLHAALMPWGASVLASSSRPLEVVDMPEPPPLAQGVPDLTVGRVWTPERLVPGVPAEVRFEVLNLSSEPASVRPPAPWWVDAVWLSRDRAWDEGDVLLTEADALRRLGAGAVYEVKRTVTLPVDETTETQAGDAGMGTAPGPPAESASVESSDAIDGPAFLLLMTDAGDAVDEGEHEDNNVKAVPVEVRRDPAEPEPPPLGKDDAPTRLTVAWISHEAFEELQAPESRTIQPAVQSKVDPTPDSPLRPADAVAASGAASEALPETLPATADSAEPGLAEPLVAELASAAKSLLDRAAEGIARLPQPIEDANETSESKDPAEQVAEADADQTADQTEATDSTEQTTEQTTQYDSEDQADADTETEAQPPTESTAEVTPDDATSTPRDAADADAADLVSVNLRQAGAVKVSEGLEVIPSAPDIAVTALLTTIPNDPVVQITFNPDGSVRDAGFIRPTGSVMFDSPIRSALFRWRARGAQLEEWTGPRTFRFVIELRARR